MQKELNLDRSIGEISRRLKDHIGSNGSVHLPVSNDAAGFMTPNMLEQHNAFFIKRTRKDNVDILTLPAGHYEGTGLLNHPAHPTMATDWLTNIDVERGSDGRAQFRIEDNYRGNVYHRTVHSGGDPETGTRDWVKDVGAITIWRGSSKLKNPITLSLPLIDASDTHRFSEILVTYVTDTGQYGTQKGRENGVVINCFNLSNTENSSTVNIYEAEVNFPTADTATVVRNKSVIIYSDEAESDANARVGIEDNQPITILKIEGII